MRAYFEGVGLAFAGLKGALGSRKVRKAYLRYVAAVLVLALLLEYLAFHLLAEDLPTWIDALVQALTPQSTPGTPAAEQGWWASTLAGLSTAQDYAIRTLSWILGVLVWLLCAILAPYIAFALTNAVVPMFNESIFMGALEEVDLPLHESLELRLGRSLAQTFAHSMMRLARYLLVSLGILLLGLVPVVGTLISSALSAIWTAHNVSYELLEPYFDRRAEPRSEDKRMLVQNRGLRFGFATPVALLLAIPVVGVFFFAMAQASAACLVSRMESKALDLPS